MRELQKMAKNPTAEEVDSLVRQFKWFIAGVVLLISVPLIIYAFYLNQRLTGFEDSLKYRPPAVDLKGVDEQELAKLASNPARGGTVYVPAYSHIYRTNGAPNLLTITLSIRNTSPESGIVVKSVRYFDTKGHEVKSFLDRALSLAPLESTEFFVDREDSSGGSGANFLVEWLADQVVSEPVIEAVMADTERQQGIVFVRSGVVIRELSPASTTEEPKAVEPEPEEQKSEAPADPPTEVQK